MAISVDRKKLHAALKLSVSPSKHSMPILSSVLLSATNGVISVCSTDLVCSVVSEISVSDTGHSAICINAKELTDLVSHASGSEISIKITERFQCEIKSGKTKYRLVGEDPRNFPKLIGDSPDKVYVDSEVLIGLMDRTLFAVAKDENRINLAGVHLESDPDGMTASSTDGHRCCRVRADQPAGVWSGIIPTVGCEAIKQICGQGPHVWMTMDRDAVWVTQDTSTLRVALIKAVPPPVGMVMAGERPNVLTVSREVLLKSMKRASQMATGDIPVRMTVTVDGVVVGAQNPKLGEITDTLIDTEYNGEPMTIGFNPKYMVDFLTHMDCNSVKISMASPLEPMLIEGDFEGIILPMRIT